MTPALNPISNPANCFRQTAPSSTAAATCTATPFLRRNSQENSSSGGHHHQVVNLYDQVGCSLRGTPGYIPAEISTAALNMPASITPTRILLIPAFCELAGGMDVRLIPGNKISPIAKAIITKTAEVFLKDGTYVDTWENLAPNPEDA